MARTPKDTAASVALGRSLMKLRAKKGNVAYERIARDLEVSYAVTMSTEQARKFHTGAVDPHTAPIEQLAALASYYGVGMSKLSPVAGQRWDTSRDLLMSCSRWMTIPAVDGRVLVGAA